MWFKASQLSWQPTAPDLRRTNHCSQFFIIVRWVAHSVHHLHAHAANKTATEVSKCIKSKLAVVFAKATVSCNIKKKIHIKSIYSFSSGRTISALKKVCLLSTYYKRFNIQMDIFKEGTKEENSVETSKA